jgi:hypothetical protein
MTRMQVVQGIQGSLEYRDRVVDDLFARYLGRAVDPFGRDGFRQFFAAGGTAEGAALVILTSQEYVQFQAGGNFNGYLDAVYADVLGRAVDPLGRAFWNEFVVDDHTLADVAFGILGSLESNGREVRGYYNQFLGREPDAFGFNIFVNQLATGTTNEQVIASIVGSEEFFQRFCG